ncbi:hypothetical protein [Peribacillus sp. SCS-37]|uniref:hypothetical protein n=1 Tax=Paraperibacillus esterisolvens TaxID=3115296 RepID=UPI003906CEEE
MRVLTVYSIIFMLLIAAGCSSKEQIDKNKVSYTAEFKGQSDGNAFTVSDQVKGNYLKDDKRAYETHKIKITWKQESPPKDVRVVLGYYEYGSTEYRLERNTGTTDIDIPLKNGVAEGTHVVQYSYGDQKPALLNKLAGTVDYSDETVGTVQDSFILKK